MNTWEYILKYKYKNYSSTTAARAVFKTKNYSLAHVYRCVGEIELSSRWILELTTCPE